MNICLRSNQYTSCICANGYFLLKTYTRYLVGILLNVLTNFPWLIKLGLWPGKWIDYLWQEVWTAPQWRTSWLKTEASPMTRERLIWRPDNYKKFSFESPEVMHEEKSALHFSIIKQKATEMGRSHGRPYIWTVFLMPKSCNFRLFFRMNIPFSLHMLIISITYKFCSILCIFNYTFYKKKFWQKSFLTFLLGFVC